MDFAQQQRNPLKHLVGITCVVIFHIILVYALLHGLAQRVVDVIKPPVEAKIVEEVKPPPPPEIKLPPPPKLTAPPPPFIPPPEVNITTPPPPPQVAVTQTAPPVAQPFTPATPQASVAGPPAPVVKGVKASCPNVSSVQTQLEYPSRAARANIDSGEVQLTFVVTQSGAITNVNITSSTNRLFNETALNAVKLLKCLPQPTDQPVSWSLGFRLE